MCALHTAEVRPATWRRVRLSSSKASCMLRCNLLTTAWLLLLMGQLCGNDLGVASNCVVSLWPCCSQLPSNRTLKLVCKSSQTVHELQTSIPTRFTTSSSPAECLLRPPAQESPIVSQQQFCMNEELQTISQGSWLEAIPHASAICQGVEQLRSSVSQQCCAVLQAPQYVASTVSQLVYSPWGALGLAIAAAIGLLRLKRMIGYQTTRDDLYQDMDEQLVAYNAQRLTRYKQDIMGVLTNNQNNQAQAGASTEISAESLASSDEETLSSSLAMGVVTDKSVRSEWQRFLACSKATQVREVWDVSMLEELRRQELSKGKLEEISQKLRQRIKETDVADKPVITLDDLEEETMEQRAARRKARMAGEFATDSDVAVMLGKPAGPKHRASTPHIDLDGGGGGGGGGSEGQVPQQRTGLRVPLRVEEARKQLKDRRAL